MDDEKEKVFADFLGDRVVIDEKKDPENPEEEKEKEKDPEAEEDQENPLDRELGLYEFIYTKSGNVLMNQETYQRLMSKFI